MIGDLSATFRRVIDPATVRRGDRVGAPHRRGVVRHGPRVVSWSSRRTSRPSSRPAPGRRRPASSRCPPATVWRPFRWYLEQLQRGRDVVVRQPARRPARPRRVAERELRVAASGCGRS
ncbi:MAG: hypothetical protein MZV70_07950 [Desulfobacterales bacterium]|nr:hypothetical protein [Desulfobacterales bacterium]